MSLLVTLVIVVHVLVSLGLIVAILLHQGKGYGLSGALGGGLPSTFSGSSLVERNLDRITIVLAVVFVTTTIILTLIFKV